MPGLLHVTLFWVAVVACAVAQWFILRGVLRTAPDGAVSPNVRTPNRATEIFWAILPAFFLVAAFLYAWRAMNPPSERTLEFTRPAGAISSQPAGAVSAA